MELIRHLTLTKKKKNTKKSQKNINFSGRIRYPAEFYHHISPRICYHPKFVPQNRYHPKFRTDTDKLISWSTSSCKIDTNSIDNNSSSGDIIWLHPNCGGNNCLMYLGGNNISNNNFSLTNSELNTINSTNRAILYLGDINDISTNDISLIYIYGITKFIYKFIKFKWYNYF